MFTKIISSSPSLDLKELHPLPQKDIHRLSVFRKFFLILFTGGISFCSNSQEELMLPSRSPDFTIQMGSQSFEMNQDVQVELTELKETVSFVWKNSTVYDTLQKHLYFRFSEESTHLGEMIPVGDKEKFDLDSTLIQADKQYAVELFRPEKITKSDSKTKAEKYISLGKSPLFSWKKISNPPEVTKIVMHLGTTPDEWTETPLTLNESAPLFVYVDHIPSDVDTLRLQWTDLLVPSLKNRVFSASERIHSTSKSQKQETRVLSQNASPQKRVLPLAKSVSDSISSLSKRDAQQNELWICSPLRPCEIPVVGDHTPIVEWKNASGFEGHSYVFELKAHHQGSQESWEIVQSLPISFEPLPAQEWISFDSTSVEWSQQGNVWTTGDLVEVDAKSPVQVHVKNSPALWNPEDFQIEFFDMSNSTSLGVFSASALSPLSKKAKIGKDDIWSGEFVLENLLTVPENTALQAVWIAPVTENHPQEDRFDSALFFVGKAAEINVQWRKSDALDTDYQNQLLSIKPSESVLVKGDILSSVENIDKIQLSWRKTSKEEGSSAKMARPRGVLSSKEENTTCATSPCEISAQQLSQGVEISATNWEENQAYDLSVSVSFDLATQNPARSVKKARAMANSALFEVYSTPDFVQVEEEVVTPPVSDWNILIFMQPNSLDSSQVYAQDEWIPFLDHLAGDTLIHLEGIENVDWVKQVNLKLDRWEHTKKETSLTVWEETLTGANILDSISIPESVFQMEERYSLLTEIQFVSGETMNFQSSDLQFTSLEYLAIKLAVDPTNTSNFEEIELNETPEWISVDRPNSMGLKFFGFDEKQDEITKVTLSLYDITETGGILPSSIAISVPSLEGLSPQETIIYRTIDAPYFERGHDYQLEGLIYVGNMVYRIHSHKFRYLLNSTR